MLKKTFWALFVIFVVLPASAFLAGMAAIWIAGQLVQNM